MTLNATVTVDVAVICPLMTVRNTALLAISTPHDERNYMSQMITMKDPKNKDEDFFLTIRVGSSCEPCLAAGKVCTHKTKQASLQTRVNAQLMVLNHGADNKCFFVCVVLLITTNSVCLGNRQNARNEFA